MTRNLGDLVKKEYFVLDSEYLTTQLVVVPKYVLKYSPFLTAFLTLPDFLVLEKDLA